MKTKVIILIAAFIQGMAIAQTPIIFQPGPGQNDGSDMGTIDAGMDAFIVQNTEGSYGDHPGLVSLPPSNCNETESIIFLRFDVSSLPTNVDSVFANFYHYPQTNYCYSNCDAWWSIAPITDEWDEMNIDWFSNIQHGEPYTEDIHFVFPDPGGWHKYDITQLYNDWKSGDLFNYGMTIYSNSEGCNNAAIMFTTASSDDTTGGGIYRPYLEIYETPNDVNPTLKDNLAAKVYPNPANDNITLSYTLKTPMPVSIRVDGIDGRNWFLQAATELEEGSHTTPIRIAKLAAGIYMLVMETPMGTLREKIIVN
jgi:hypothetical protein